MTGPLPNPAARTKRSRANKKVSNSLVALSSAAVLAVYTAGYLRTKPAADRLEVATASSRTASSRTFPEPAAVLSAVPAPTPALNDASTPQPSSTPPAMPAAELTASVTEPRTAEPVAVPPVPPRGEYNDGIYRGWGYSRHGDIQASVVVKGGRIVSADIAQCRTRYSCNWVEYLPDQIVSRQRALVDAVSGATESSFAFEDAVTAALSRAK